MIFSHAVGLVGYWELRREKSSRQRRGFADSIENAAAGTQKPRLGIENQDPSTQRGDDPNTKRIG